MILTALKRITKHLDHKSFMKTLESEEKQHKKDLELMKSNDFNEKIMENPFYMDLFELGDIVEEHLKEAVVTMQDQGIGVTECWGVISNHVDYSFFLEDYKIRIPNIVLKHFSKGDICRFFNESGFTKEYHGHILTIEFEVIGSDLHMECGEVQ